MTTVNDTEIKVYDQLMEVRRCIDALKDVSENIPDDDKYAAVLGIVTERLDSEFTHLMPIALTAATDAQTRSDCTAVLQEVTA